MRKISARRQRWKARKQRRRVLHNGNGFVAASKLIRPLQRAGMVMTVTPCTGERECARRVRQMGGVPKKDEAALWQRIASAWS